MIAVPPEPDPDFVFEFKFHKERETNGPRTTNAGQIFRYVFRLASYLDYYTDSSRCFVVYTTEPPMANYFRNPANNMDDFFDLGIGKTLHIDKDYVENHAGTFIGACRAVHDCRVSARFKCDDDLFSVRIFEIMLTRAET